MAAASCCPTGTRACISRMRAGHDGFFVKVSASEWWNLIMIPNAKWQLYSYINSHSIFGPRKIRSPSFAGIPAGLKLLIATSIPKVSIAIMMGLSHPTTWRTFWMGTLGEFPDDSYGFRKIDQANLGAFVNTSLKEIARSCSRHFVSFINVNSCIPPMLCKSKHVVLNLRDTVLDMSDFFWDQVARTSEIPYNPKYIHLHKLPAILIWKP